MATEPISYQDSPLHLIAFNGLEDELFGVPGTPERIEYEDRMAKALNVEVKILLQPALPQA
jgi:hypothetical protein